MYYETPYNDEYYYNILKISKDSNIDVIKKAYRKLSIKCHPDKNNNNNNEEFNNITNAYNYLLNKEKTLSSNAITNINSKINDKINDKQNNINYNSYVNMKDTNNCKEIIQNTSSNLNVINNYNIIEKCNQDIILYKEITYSQSYLSTNIPIIIERIVFNNNIIRDEKETIYINIPKGIDENEIITINNKGHCYNNIYTNIKINIKLSNHEYFTRNGLDLIYTANITLKESLTGFNIIIKHLNNKYYKLKNTDDEIINNNSYRTLSGLGFIRDEYTGDLIIKFNVDYSLKLSKDTIKQLKDIL